MKHYFGHMKTGMLEVLQADDRVSGEAFSSAFTEMEFIDFVLDNLLLLLIQGKTSCEVLKETIRRTIYL